MALGVGFGHHRQQLARPRLRQLESKPHDAFNPGTRHDRQIGSDFDRVALMRPAADARVFTFRVLAHDDPVQVFTRAALERRLNARQNARWPDVGVLVKALANFQAQAPQRDVVRDVRVARRAKQNRILVAQRIKAVFRHHLAVRAIPVTTPSKVLKRKFKIADGSQGLQHLLARRHDFLANAVAGDAGDAVCFHEAVLSRAVK